VAYFNLLFQNFPEGTEENHKTFNHDSWSRGRDFDPGPLEYEAGVLPTRPYCKMVSIAVHSLWCSLATDIFGLWKFLFQNYFVSLHQKYRAEQSVATLVVSLFKQTYSHILIGLTTNYALCSKWHITFC
jgi:hypothetical protein